MRPQIEGPARPQDYTQDADDVMLIQYCLALGMQDLLKREAMYSNGGGWCSGTGLHRHRTLQQAAGQVWPRL